MVEHDFQIDIPDDERTDPDFADPDMSVDWTFDGSSRPFERELLARGFLGAAGMEGDGHPVGCSVSFAQVVLLQLKRESKRRYALLRKVNVGAVAREVRAVCEGEPRPEGGGLERQGDTRPTGGVMTRLKLSHGMLSETWAPDDAPIRKLEPWIFDYGDEVGWTMQLTDEDDPTTITDGGVKLHLNGATYHVQTEEG